MDREMPMDALSLLKDDHEKVKKLVKEVEGTTARSTKQRGELFQTIVDELTVHERIEEEIFYPTLQKHEKAKELVLESYVEHGVVDDLLDEISTVDVGDERWLPAFKVFRENLEHHIEEEEKELFPKTKSIFSEEQLVTLGAEMAALKEQAQMELIEEATEEV
jgi:hemerythrin-like domain-containing protein